MLTNEDQFVFQQEQIESLKLLEDSEYIDLYFGDESHFGLTPNVPYAWQTKGSPIFPILLPASKGKYLNVVGVMSRKNNLFFEVLETTFNSDMAILLWTSLLPRQLKRLS